MKKVISIGLSFMLLLCLCTPSFASFSYEDSIDSALIKRGYPYVYLENITQDMKESLYEKTDLVFDGATITTYDEESGEIVDYEIPASGIVTCGQIPDTSLVLTITFSKSLDTGYVFVTYGYQWKKHPVNRYQDPICVSWDSKYFEMPDNSFYKCDKFTADAPLSDGTTTSVLGVQSSSKKYANASPSGVSWYADLPGYTKGYTYKTIYGYAEFYLKPKVSKFTTTLYGHYVHALTSFSLSVPIPKFGGSFTVSGNSPYDELGNQRTYSYS